MSNSFETPTFIDEKNEMSAASLTFLMEAEERPGIKVIGVGGGGSNAVNYMHKRGIDGVDFIVCNTDMQALKSSPVPGKLPIGQHGAGGRPEIGAKRAREHADEILKSCEHDTRMLFIAACMGGGTGTGAAPVIAEIVKQIKIQDDDINDILVVAVVTMPFKFEGHRKLKSAAAGIRELRKYADSVIVINNDKLRSFGNIPMPEAFALADNILYTATNGISQIITRNDYINVDFHDVYSIMSGSRTALMGVGEGEGENRILEAIEAAASSVLLDDQDIHNAKGCLATVIYSSEHPVTMDEFAFFSEYICDNIIDSENPDVDVIWGTGVDDSLGAKVQVTLIATGFENSLLEEEIAQLPEKKKETAPEPKKEDHVVIDFESEQPKPFVPEPVKEEPVRAEVKNQPEEEEIKIVQQPAAETSAPTIEETKPEAQKGHIVVNLDDDEVKLVPDEPSKEFAPTHKMEPAPAPKTEPADEPFIVKHSGETVDLSSVISDMKKTEPEPAKPSPAPAMPFKPAATAAAPKETKAAISEDTFKDRIKRMRALLSRGSEGIAEANAALDTTGFFQSPHSSVSEVAESMIDNNGAISANPYLYGNPD